MHFQRQYVIICGTTLCVIYCFIALHKPLLAYVDFTVGAIHERFLILIRSLTESPMTLAF